MPQLLDLEELVVRAQEGDGEAYGDIVTRFQDMALNYAYSLVGDYDLAEDVKQESFLTAYCQLVALSKPGAFPGWFRNIVRNHSIDLKRGRQILTVPLEKVVNIEDQRPTPYQRIEERETREAVQDALNRLPEEERQAIQLFYLEERSLPEICALTGASREAIKSRLHSARTRLRQRSILMAKDSVRKESPADAKRLAQAASTEAVDLFDKELKNLVQSPSPEQTRIIDLVCAKGRLLRFAGKMDEALASFKEAITWPATKAVPQFEARLRAEIGFTYIRKSDYALAKSELDFSKKMLVDKQELSGLCSSILNGLGVCEWEKGDYLKAREHYEQALRISQTRKDKADEAVIMGNIALLDWKNGQLEKSLKGFRACSRYWRLIGNKYHLAQSLMHIGILEETFGQATKANEHYREALDLSKSLKFLLLQSHINLNLANLALNQRKWDIAGRYSREGFDIAGKTADRRAQSIALENLALSQIGLGQYANAEKTTKEAQDIAQSLGDLERIVVLDLVDIERFIEQKQCEGALETLQRVRATVEAKGFMSTLPWVLRLQSHAEVLVGDYKSARETVKLGLGESRRQKNVPEIRKLTRLETLLNRLEKK